MPGNYAKPFRPLPPNSNLPYAHPNHLSGCDVIPKWLNVTTVRQAAFTNGVDPSGGYTITNAAPFYRVDQTFDIGSSGLGICATSPVGTCGVWLARLDLNGVVERAIQDGIDDINGCATSDPTHASRDHNCYQKSGTKDFRKCRQQGGKWSVARKVWHGNPGFTSNDNCAKDPNIAPDQTKYLRVDYDLHYYSEFLQFTSSTWVGFSQGALNGYAEIGRYTGITKSVINSAGYTYSFDPYAPSVPTFPKTVVTGLNTGTYDDGSGPVPKVGLGAPLDGLVGLGGYTCGNYPTTPLGALDSIITFWNSLSENALSFTPLPAITDPDNYSAGASGSGETSGFPLLLFPYSISLSWQRSKDSFTFAVDMVIGNEFGTTHKTCSGNISLGAPYTATDLLTDINTLHQNYDLTPNPDCPWRTDMELANAPMACYDEVPMPVALGVSSTFGNNDYTQPQNGDGTWPQIAWMDDNDIFWYSPSGGTGGIDDAGGNTLVTGIRTGQLISRNPAGYDRHFWFGFNEFKRFINYLEDGTQDGYQWLNVAHGGFSDSYVPETTLRWQDKEAAQYETNPPSAAPPSYGNLPKSWIREINGVCVSGKYVEARQTWPSVNFGRPYGLDKFAVDQTTVCVVIATGVMSFTGNATNAMATGDYVMVGGDGIYQITVTPTSGNADGRYASPLAQFNYSLGSKLADIPAGCDIGGGYIGKVRFWTAPPFGLLAAMGVYDSGTNKTTFTIPATPYWVSISGGAITLAVDLYLPDASNGNPHTALTTSITLTKTNVGDVTAYVTGDYHAAKFIIPHLHYSGAQFLPEYDDDRPKGDFVQVQWQFNNRAAQPGVTSPPTWYDGIAGVTGISVTDANLKFSPCCPSVVGFVPFYSPGILGSFVPMGGAPMSAPATPTEHFSCQNLGQMPDSFIADDLFGGFWMGTAETTMVDSFWQAPFKPDADIVFPDILNWGEDDGTGKPDSEDVSEGGATIYSKYYAHHPLVEARASLPHNLGWSGTDSPPALPAGVSIGFDTGVNSIPPPYWPGGIPVGGADGQYGDVTTTFGLYQTFCATIAANGRFAADYQKFVSC